MSDWLSVLCGVLFLYRGIQDLRNGSGTGWSSEDEKKNFSKFSGIALLRCGAVYLVNVFLPRVEPHRLHRFPDFQSLLPWHTERRQKVIDLLLHIVFSPATMRKNAGGILIWSSMSFSGS